MSIRRTTITLILLVLGASTASFLIRAEVRADDPNVLSRVLGGQMYDKWWTAANLPEPVGDHPLYPPAGQQSGSTTWRCKECHGWDYKGVDGAYGSGSHYTGIRGVYGSTMTSEEMFDLIKEDTGTNGHGYGNTGLSDEDIGMIVDFLQGAVVDTDVYIDGNNEFIGDAADGRWGYLAAGGHYNCANCHGEDGTEINFGTPADPTYVRDIAVDNPWELLHKVRCGQPGTLMPSWLLVNGADQGAADIGRYLQDDFPAADYVGDNACSGCHANFPTTGFFDAYRDSGHPYKLFHAAGQEPPADTWPHTPVPPLPVVNGTQLQWSDIEYVIGNYNWKARFVDHDGYIYTGAADETTQWNLATQEWVPYHAGEVDKPYDCGRCHTTGYQPEGNQLGLPGLIGTWTEEGVRCEACHGPAGDHVVHQGEMLPAGGKTCAECHYRDAQFRMPWKGGFMRHHQQAEDFSHSPHGVMLTCNTCHDPHRSTLNNDGGVIADCTDCHPGSADNGFYVIDEMWFLDCTDCHMPYMTKSAVAVNDYKADVRGHLFQITREPLFAADNVYEDNGNFYWNQENGESFITLDYACMGCHTQVGIPLTMEEASNYAVRIHTDHALPSPADPLPCPCDCEETPDGTVDVGDFLALLAQWGAPGACDCEDPPDGAVDVGDFLAILAAWGACP
ncbi:MAG: multiheme c-type cytochrome [Planctomycetota bacterium]